MDNWLDRSRLLIKDDGLEKLGNAGVLVVGLGGVGGFAAEFLARAGVGRMTIVDGDCVGITNINRQIAALNSTVGMPKADVMAARIKDINPVIDLRTDRRFLCPEDVRDVVFSDDYDYVVDCIDSISPKLALIYSCLEKGVPLVSAMGAGGRMDPSAVRVADISKSKNCPLARNIRKRIKTETGRHARGFDVVYSEELADESSMEITEDEQFKRSYYGTVSYMPAVFGLYAASHVIRKLTGKGK